MKCEICKFENVTQRIFENIHLIKICNKCEYIKILYNEFISLCYEYLSNNKEINDLTTLRIGWALSKIDIDKLSAKKTFLTKCNFCKSNENLYEIKFPYN